MIKLVSVLAHPVRLAAVGVGVGGLVLTAGGAFSVLNATAGNATPQSVNAGTMKLKMFETGNGINNTLAIDAMKPGDTQNRFIQLDNTGTLTGRSLTVRVAASSSNKLSNDAVNGLQVTLTSCTVAWTTAGVCSGTQATILAATPLSSLNTFNATTITGTIADPLEVRVTIALPDQGECNADAAATAQYAADCTTPLTGGTIQGLTNGLSFTFKQTQQVASTVNS